MARKQKRKPSFFTVLDEGHYTSKLPIPRAFVKKHKFVLPENVMLRSSSGEIWDVKIEEIGKDKCFTMGWDKFARDAELKMKEFLVFWFNVNDSIFDVSVFGSRGLKRDFSVKNVVLIDDDDLDDDDDDDDDDDLEDDDDDDDDDDAPAGLMMIKNDNQTIRSRADVDNEAGNSGTKNPRLNLLLKKCHLSRVPLPKRFAVAAGLRSQKATTLEYPPSTRRWAVVLDHFPKLNHFRMELCGGWSDFRRENGLVYGKTYSLEYVEDTNVIEVKLLHD